MYSTPEMGKVGVEMYPKVRGHFFFFLQSTKIGKDTKIMIQMLVNI